MIKTYIGFDVGTHKTGIAVGNNITKKAHGIKVIISQKNKTDWQSIDDIIYQYQPTKLIVGLPLFNDKMQKLSYIAQSFSKAIQSRYNKPTLLVNEHLSSNEAKKQLKYNANHKNANPMNVDKMAAALILQTYLNEL